jgi:hypothetical protein
MTLFLPQPNDRDLMRQFFLIIPPLNVMRIDMRQSGRAVAMAMGFRQSCTSA